MGKIEDSGSFKENLQAYRHEFDRGAKLFKEALDEYSHTEDKNKKAQLEKVMKETKHAMNQIINSVLRKKGSVFLNKLNTDYDDVSKKASKENVERLKTDIDDIGKIL